MSEEPFFSILIPAWNAGATLDETIRSVVAQTFGRWEIRLVDDGSTDDTLAIARRWEGEDPRIHVTSTEQGGTARARNIAARSAVAPYLALLDADDRYLPGYLEEMHRFIGAHPGYGFYSCALLYVLPIGVKLRLPGATRRLRPVSYTLRDLLRGNRVAVTAVVSAQAFRAVGGFREDVYVEDYDLWLRLLAAGHRHLHHPVPLALYRATPGSKSAQRLRAVEETISVLRDLDERHRLSPEEQCALADSIDRLESTARLAGLEARIACGDFTGARRVYLKHARGVPTWVSRFAGAAAMLVSPRLYRALLIRPAEPDESNDGR